jgi:hypothetical protein
MNPPTNTSAQNLRLSKIQNRRFDGQDKFSIGKRGEPIPGELDPVTIARKQRRAAKRPVILTKRIKRLELELTWNAREMEQLRKATEGKQMDGKSKRLFNELQLQARALQSALMTTKQSLAAVKGEA